MIKRILLLSTFLVNLNVFSQVAIGSQNPHATAELDMSQSKKGFIAPRIPLTSRNDVTTITSPATGLIVYNTTNDATNQLVPGYYYFNGTNWGPLSGSTQTIEFVVNEIDANVLGYYPFRNGVDAPATMTLNGVTATKRKCVQFSTNGHYYCGYDLSAGIDWYTAYLFGKNADGYLATFTTNVEWNFVKSNLLDSPGSALNAGNNIWFGFTKIDYPGKMLVDTNGNALSVYRWITGSEALVNWSNSATTQPAQWLGGYPNSTQRCGRIVKESGRNWATYPCTSTTDSTTPFNHIIIEFLN